MGQLLLAGLLRLRVLVRHWLLRLVRRYRSVELQHAQDLTLDLLKKHPVGFIVGPVVVTASAATVGRRPTVRSAGLLDVLLILFLLIGLYLIAQIGERPAVELELGHKRKVAHC